MSMSQQNHLRLQVMNSIQHPEEYYQRALASNGVAFQELTHAEIAMYRATMDAIEADIRIHIAETMLETDVHSIDIENLLPNEQRLNSELNTE